MTTPETGACEVIIAQFVWGGVRCGKEASVKVPDEVMGQRFICLEHLARYPKRRETR